jgi:hypothetical protein
MKLSASSLCSSGHVSVSSSVSPSSPVGVMDQCEYGRMATVEAAPDAAWDQHRGLLQFRKE